MTGLFSVTFAGLILDEPAGGQCPVNAEAVGALSSYRYNHAADWAGAAHGLEWRINVTYPQKDENGVAQKDGTFPYKVPFTMTLGSAANDWAGGPNAGSGTVTLSNGGRTGHLVLSGQPAYSNGRSGHAFIDASWTC